MLNETKTRTKSDADILCPYKITHQVGKFGAIPQTDPDDISQRTPDFWPIFEFQVLKMVGGRPIPIEVCISKRWSSSLHELQNFKGKAS